MRVPGSLATVLRGTRSAVGFVSTAVLLGCAGLVALVGAPEAVALKASESFEARPEYVKRQAVAAPEAIAYLDQQREANGIPGGLVEEPHLSEGCEQYTNMYEPKAGQYPHTELPEQPGFTQAGLEAASSSDLSPENEMWSSTVNPWVGAPLHLSALFSPFVTSAWYGEHHGRANPAGGQSACMGTGGERAFAGPTFFSLPGNGSAAVPFAEMSDEEPYTPAEAVGLPSNTTTGPTFILWPEGTAASLSSVTLVTSSGTPVTIRVATPQTPSPAQPPGFPDVATIGEYSRGASFVIPVQPLAGSTSYVLTAIWQPPTGSPLTQTIRFTTATRYVGRLTFRTSGKRVIVSGTPIIGQRVTIQAAWGVTVCVEPRHPCPTDAIRHEFYPPTKRTLRLTKPSISMVLPRRVRGTTVFEVIVTMPEFAAYGQLWISNTLAAMSR
jgi:hypothetical protein